MLVVVLNMPEHSSFQDMLFPMLFISKYAKSYASIMDISLIVAEKVKAGVRHAVASRNVTGRTKERIAQSKQARAGSLGFVA